MGWRGLNYSGSGYRQVVDCSESSNEIWVPYNTGALLTSFSRRTLLHGKREYLGPGFLFLTNIYMNPFVLSHGLVL
jgi:hypothetical protein